VSPAGGCYPLFIDDYFLSSYFLSHRSSPLFIADYFLSSYFLSHRSSPILLPTLDRRILSFFLLPFSPFITHPTTLQVSSSSAKTTTTAQTSRSYTRRPCSVIGEYKSAAIGMASPPSHFITGITRCCSCASQFIPVGVPQNPLLIHE
jgi:hypothetical protein